MYYINSILVVTMALLIWSIDAQSTVVDENITLQENGNITWSICECGLFSTTEPTPEQEPIIKINPVNVTCPDNNDTCLQMCFSIAMSAKKKGPGLLCDKLGEAEDFHASIFLRGCDDKEWNYTGLTCPEPFCCHEKKPIPCHEPEDFHEDEDLTTIKQDPDPEQQKPVTEKKLPSPDQ